MVKNTSLIKSLVQIVEEELNIELKPGDLSYIRLLNHLKFTIDRVKASKTMDNPMTANIKEKFFESYKIAEKIGQKINQKLGSSIDDNELSYIALHIQRIKVK